MNDCIDEVARQRITDHEKHCAERWKQAQKSIDRLYGRWWWLLTAIIAGQGAVIVTLLKLAKVF